MSNKPPYEQLEKKVQELEQEIKHCQPFLKMLRLMCDEVPDMIWAKDTEKRYVFVNKALCRNLLNTDDTEEPIGKTDFFLQNVRGYVIPMIPTGIHLVTCAVIRI